MLIMFLLLYIIIFVGVVWSIVNLRNQMIFLPKFKNITYKKHPLIGSEILKKLNIETEYKQILVFSPTCDICHEEVERLVHSSKLQVLFLGNAVDMSVYEEFIQPYKNKYEFFPLELHQLKNLNINFYPMFMKLNSKGKVEDLSSKSIF
ncbi:MAG: hypothetical protein ACQEWE_05930 [Bacillota bacterium]